MWLHNFVIFIGTFVILSALLIALAFRNKEKPLYFKYIFLFIILGILMSLNSFTLGMKWGYSDNSNFKIPSIIQEVIILLQYTCLSLLFLKLANGSTFGKKILRIFGISIFILLGLFFLTFSTNIDVRPTFAIPFFQIAYCYLYTKKLLSKNSTIILTKSVGFWITLGVFFSSCISIPVVTLVKFIPKDHLYFDIRMQIFSINNIARIILYIFIIKSYLCLRHPQSSY